ncbi:MAG: tail fiber domain-containing protein, partial [Deltaproteobacteria bacterium]|nr:tail fiber domain-containing protein [Deltaproteobacteria bacterium]
MLQNRGKGGATESLNQPCTPLAIHKGRAVPLRASLYVRGEGHEVAGVSYEWKREEYPDWGFKDSRQIGLLAQDVERVIPELVSADETG